MRRPSFPTVISLIALFVALGGTSYAVTKLPANSVGGREVRPNSLTGGDIRNGSIASKDLAPSARGQRGPRGPQGPQGPAGGGTSAAAPEGWHVMPLSPGWTNYGGAYQQAQYRKDAAGKVHLRGLVAKSGTPASGDVIATMPAGYRPPARLLFSVGAGDSADRYGRTDVLPNGEVTFIVGATVDAGDFTSLDNISFWTD
jgi:hypothetical protein